MGIWSVLVVLSFIISYFGKYLYLNFLNYAYKYAVVPWLGLSITLSVIKYFLLNVINYI